MEDKLTSVTVTKDPKEKRKYAFDKTTEEYEQMSRYKKSTLKSVKKGSKSQAVTM